MYCHEVTYAGHFMVFTLGSCSSVGHLCHFTIRKLSNVTRVFITDKHKTLYTILYNLLKINVRGLFNCFDILKLKGYVILLFLTMLPQLLYYTIP